MRHLKLRSPSKAPGSITRTFGIVAVVKEEQPDHKKDENDRHSKFSWGDL